MALQGEEATRFLRSLRAVRRFDPREVPLDVLNDVLETARWTASAKNTQPWRLIVVRDSGTLDQLAGCGQFASHLKNAPLAIVLVMHSRGAAFDAGRLAHNVMLAAWAHGVGTCIGWFWPDDNEARARELLGVPAERSVQVGISLGYPADEDALWVSRTPAATSGFPVGRMPLDELVSWDRFGSPSPAAANEPRGKAAP